MEDGIVRHFYQVLLDPDVVRLTLLSRWSVSEELYKEEHELGYDRLTEVEKDQAASTAPLSNEDDELRNQEQS